MNDRANNIRNIKKEAEYPKKSKRDLDEAKYKLLARAHLKSHPLCACGCGRKAVEVHHPKGRIGKLLTDTKLFKGLARTCHRKAHNDPKWALAKGISFSRLNKT